MSTNESDRQKAVLKEALKEWMDEKFAQFGKWTLGTIASLVLFAIANLIFWTNGWRPL